MRIDCAIGPFDGGLGAWCYKYSHPTCMDVPPAKVRSVLPLRPPPVDARGCAWSLEQGGRVVPCGRHRRRWRRRRR